MDTFKSDEITKLYSKLIQVEFIKAPKKSWFMSKIQKMHSREEGWDDVACYQKINNLNAGVIKAFNELKGIVIEVDDKLLKSMHLVGTKYDIGRYVVHTKVHKDYLALLQNNKLSMQSLMSTLSSIIDDTTWTGTLYSKYFNDLVQIMKDLDLIITTSTMLYVVYTQNGNSITRFEFTDTDLVQIKLDETEREQKETNTDSKVYSKHGDIKTDTVEGTKDAEQSIKSNDNDNKTVETTKDTQNTSQDAEQPSKDNENKESLDTLNAKCTDGETKIDDEYIADYIQKLIFSSDTSSNIEYTETMSNNIEYTEKQNKVYNRKSKKHTKNAKDAYIDKFIEESVSSTHTSEKVADTYKRHDCATDREMAVQSSIEQSTLSLRFVLKCLQEEHVLDDNKYTDVEIDALVEQFESELIDQLGLYNGCENNKVDSIVLRATFDKFSYNEICQLAKELKAFKRDINCHDIDSWFKEQHLDYIGEYNLISINTYKELDTDQQELIDIKEQCSEDTDESLDTTVIESTDTDNNIEQNDTEEVSAVKSFDLSSIVKLQKRLKAQENIPSTEEATKLWLIMPLINALGYNPYSSDIVPEYTLDVGVKKGEKVDYALQINNQPVALIECKKFGLTLSEKHISQLYRYFTISDVHIAILTNGDDYWFFTDSQKENVMDLEPYYKIRISEANADELSKLEQYSKDMIQYADINKVVRYEKYVSECKSLVHGLRTNNIPTWLLDTLAKRSGLDIDKPTLAEYLYTEIKKEFNGFKVSKSETKSKETPKPIENTSTKPKNTQDESKPQTELGMKMQETRSKNRKNRSNIRLNYPYVFNDYSDGDWRFHTLDYAVILGVRYDNITARDLLVHTITELFKKGKITRDAILQETQFDRAFKINAVDNCRRSCYLEDYDVYVETSYSILSIVTFIQKLLDYAGLPYESVIISFKD